MHLLDNQWVICDLKEKLQSTFIHSQVVTFGTSDFASIYIPGSSSVVAQIVVDSGIIFTRVDTIVSVAHCEKHQSIFNKNYIIKTLPFSKIFDINCFSETDISDVFSSSLFFSVLNFVRSEGMRIFEGKATYLNDVVDADYDFVIEKAIGFLSLGFWQERDPFCIEHRKYFLLVIGAVFLQICHFGILSSLLNNSSISEIMVSEISKIYIEESGNIKLTALKFSSLADLLATIERLVSKTGRRVDESSPYCDARLPDGSRLHVILPPLAINGPCLTIRKFPSKQIDASRLIELGSIHPDMLFKLQNAVANKKNILICGSTGTGKTTILNVLSSFILESERIITIEDSAELQLQKPHVIRLEARVANTEGKGEVTLRDLVRNALRMRPDRIVVGECRGAEALDMLQAMNTGHDGSLTTVHANSPIDALRRLEVLVMFASTQLPHQAIREQIASAINYIVHVVRLNGKRYVDSVWIVNGLDFVTGTYQLSKVLANVPNHALAE